MTLSKEEEEIELFLEGYIKQIRLLSGLDDIGIKVVMRNKIIEDPEWWEVIRNRFQRNKAIKDLKELVKDTGTDLSGSIRELGRKVA